MRTKTLLLTAALTAAGIGYTMAQTVYSVNVVGYVNTTVPANGYTLIANPLNATNNNLNTVMPDGSGVVDGATVVRWDATAQGFAAETPTFFAGLGWLPDATLAPGEGFFLFNSAASPFTVTFVGEVLTGSLTNSLSANYSLVANKVPQAIGLTAAGVPAADGDIVLQWDPATQNYKEGNQFFEGVGWLPAEPIPGVGEGFFYFNAGAAKNWVRTFTIQ